MMRHVPTVILVGFLISDISHAVPQKLQIDLAAIAPGSDLTLSTSPGDYNVEIINKVPSKTYTAQALLSSLTLPLLTPPSGARATESDDGESQDCEELSSGTASIGQAANEDEVATAVAKVQALLDKNVCPGLQDEAKDAIKSTQQVLPSTFSIASGQELLVTVSAEAEKWTVTYQTPARGRWFSSYGFAFVRNGDELYFSKAKSGEDGKFVITRKADNRDYDFAPSLFYSWMPMRREGKDLNFGVTAGLGFDQSNPIVFLGPMLTYNQNISLMAGVVMHKQKRLIGIYSVGDEIDSALTEDQLKEETFKPNLFFGLSFRFGTNPFAGESTTTQPSSATVKPPAADK